MPISPPESRRRNPIVIMRHSLLRHSSLYFASILFVLFCCLTAVLSDDSPAKPVTAQKPASQPAKAVRFESHVLSIFKAKCTRCHNPKSRKGELDLTTYLGVVKGGESGKILDLKDVKKSSLYEMIHDGHMPPDGKNRVTKTELEIIRRWIAAGAKSSHKQVEVKLTQHDVLPILYLRCTVCHGLRIQKAGLDLRSKAAMLKGGKSGPAIVPGDPKKSLLLKRIHAGEMPPKKLLVDFGIRPVDSSELAKLTKWIAQGAPTADVKPDVAGSTPDPLVTDADRKFWSFQPPKRPAVPKVKSQHLVRNPIDAFLLRKLEANGLSFSKPTDRFTLIRRVVFDLTGLPPQWEDVKRYVADRSPRAYENMVNRFLASPRYGERWGQYWLDVAGYSDSEGKRSADVVRPHAWRYRDYVIRAFNSDKPYDRFLLEQLAGDELLDTSRMKRLTPTAYDNLVATGFLRMAPDGTGSDIVNTVVERMEVISDELNVLGAGVMGLTIKCAQCHSHKYDPIPQRDYYRLVAVFQGAFDLHDWLRSTVVNNQSKALKGFRTLKYATAAEHRKWETATAKVKSQIAAVQSDLSKLRKSLIRKRVDDRLKKLPAGLHADLKRMLATPKNKRDAKLKALAAKYEKRLTITAAQLQRLDKTYRKKATQGNRKVRQLRANMPAEPAIRALWDRGTPSPTYLFRRGETTNPGRLIGPGVPVVLTDGKTPFKVSPPWPGAKKTGRRLAFAKWLTRPDHPLTARVMVNRIWYHHFGRGIVTSLGNFGKTGVKPTHPELLDWLATEFVRRKWRIKDIHRLILFSSAYRQVSSVTAMLEERDPDNGLLSRMPLRRKEAESVRDSLLAVAGELDLTPFGKPDPVEVRRDGLVTSKRGPNGWRRSIYILHRRKEMPTILENFDLPQMIPNCIKRPNSTVASQALHLMNNGMIRKLADRFASRVEREAGTSPGEQIERSYQLALSRSPTSEEQRLSLNTLQKLTAAWTVELKRTGKKPDAAPHRALANLCHTLLNSAAFLYVD